jgi:hypothetical protein
MIVARCQAEKQRALETPIGAIEQFFARGVFGWKDITEVVPRHKERPHPAKRAGEQPVGFLQIGWGPALRALVIDPKRRHCFSPQALQ